MKLSEYDVVDMMVGQLAMTIVRNSEVSFDKVALIWNVDVRFDCTGSRKVGT